MWARKKERAEAAVRDGATAAQPTRKPILKRPLLPPGVAPPPGISLGSEYPSTDPNDFGARPDVN